MDWSVVDSTSERVRLAQSFVNIIPSSGVSKRTLRLAANDTLASSRDWQEIFGGPTEALWFVSEVSDASMLAAFTNTPAQKMAEVVDVRLDQNASLKPFVNRVMRYDVLHPVQALARMQRTARVMFDCLGPREQDVSWVRLTLLNIAYTGLVFGWLMDRSECNHQTKSATRAVFRLLGI